jgi:hypothetical protein
MVWTRSATLSDNTGFRCRKVLEVFTMPQPLSIKVTSPVRGINRGVSREGQPPETCWDCLNVLPYDRYGRKRVAQRQGSVKLYNTKLGNSRIQGLLPVNNINYAGSSASTIVTPLNGWTVPSHVTTSTNNLAFAFNYVGSSPDTTPAYSSTLPEVGWVLTFNVLYTTSTNSSPSLVINIDPSSTTSFGSPNPRISLDFGFLSSTAASNLFVFSSTTSDFIQTTNAINAPPGSTIPCSLTWTSGGNISATLGSWATNGGGGGGSGGTFNVPVSSGSDFISMFAILDSSNQSETMTISNITLTQTIGTPSGQPGYQTLLIAVCDGYVWVANNTTIAKAAHGQATPQVSSTALVSMAYADGQVFIADGSGTLWNYTIATDTVAATVAVPSPGNITGTVPPNCNLVCNWRGRVTLAGDSQNPQNFYMARPAGTYFNTVTSTLTAIGAGVDWDYSQTDSAAAVAGNLAHSGKIGEPITALIPFSDDYLKFGCSHSLWMAQGDPADGGTITNVSNSMGIVGKDAWVVDPAGTLWFVATGGLFQVRPAWEFYRPPEPVSQQAINQSFTGLNPGTEKVTCVYDPDLLYLHIFVTPLDGSIGTHITMDARSVGQDGPPSFWPQQFSSTQGPTAATLYFSDGSPNNRAVVLGGADGYLRQWQDTALDDDGSAINASITLGPFAPVPGEAAVLTGITIDLGETPVGLSSTNWHCKAIVAAGPDAYSVTEALPNGQNLHPSPTVNMTLDRRQKVFRQRLRGGWFSLALQNLNDNAFFSFESAVLEFVPGGRNRDLR